MWILNKIRIRDSFRYQQFDICWKILQPDLIICNLGFYLVLQTHFQAAWIFHYVLSSKAAFVSEKWIIAINLCNCKFCFCIIWSRIY